MKPENEKDKQIVLIVDDVPENISILNEILHHDYIVRAAINGKKALDISQGTEQPDIILLDVMMPEVDGYEVCKKLKENPKTSHIPVIFITALNDVVDEKKGLDLGAVDYIKKPISPSIVKRRVQTQLDLVDQNRKLERMVRERTKELDESRLAIVQRLGRAAEFKDNETGLHVIRVSNFCKEIALADGMNDQDADDLLHASPMHDVGKIGIPDKILLKPGKLDTQEWQIMQRHPEIGAEIIGKHSSKVLQAAYTCALYHHEKYDGTGYPFNLKGENIPYLGRIIAIADVFDALTSERSYKKAWSVDDALKYLADNRGSHFDPHLIDIVFNIKDTILEIKKDYAE